LHKALAGLVSENGSFAAGGGVTINSAIALLRLPDDGGTVTPLFTRTDVYDSTTRQGQDFDLWTDAATIRYSRHIAANWSLGGAVKLLHNHSTGRSKTFGPRIAILLGWQIKPGPNTDDLVYQTGSGY
jgi:hypothetical protein